MARRLAWAIELEPGHFAGILFFGGEPPAHLAGLRTAYWRTRAEARAALAHVRPRDPAKYRAWPRSRVTQVVVVTIPSR